MFLRRHCSLALGAYRRCSRRSCFKPAEPCDATCRGTGLPRRRCFSRLSEGSVGFIGLGNMGSCMATSLVRAGHDVLLFDGGCPSPAYAYGVLYERPKSVVDARKAKAVAADTGATAASSLKEVAQASLFIVTMLPNTSNVEKVYLGGTSHHRREGATTDGPSLSPEKQRVRQAGNGDTETEQGLLDWVRSGTLVVDSSTIDPLASRRVNAIAEIKGVTMVDAPVSGGVPAAANATLTFMVGGTDEGLELARPLLMAMGSKAVHCGDAGAGCIAKVCNNLSLAISMIGVAEAMSLGSKMGMDAKVLASVLNSSTARCWSSEAYNPFPGVMENVPSSRGFQGGFAASLMEKDLHLALQAASESSQSLPMGAHAHQLYSQLCNEGNAHKDFSSIYELVAK